MLSGRSGNNPFPELFNPGHIGKLYLKNRLIKAPAGTFLASADGCVTERMIAHYREIARGGTGLIIVEYAYVDEKASKAQDCQLGISREFHSPGLAWLASIIRMNGAAAGIQITHAGNQRDLDNPKSISPAISPLHFERSRKIPQLLDSAEIEEIVEVFGNAALRAKTAGFDLIEVHGCNGYLITNSLSPNNKREDRYGGSLANRMRFLLEIIENIRKKVGPDYPVSVRLAGTDYATENPIPIGETIEVAKALEKSGVNAIHMSGGTHDAGDKLVVRGYRPPGYNVWAAEAVKGKVFLPVIASGAINSPQLAEDVLKENKGDFVALARPLWADPYFTVKAREGRTQDIRPCIRCNNGCGKGGVYYKAPCTVNVALGKENEFQSPALKNSRRVAIIGGGPAGMEAAHVAAELGHKVTLYEKRQLGGILLDASKLEFKPDFRTFISYLERQVIKSGVEVVYDNATVDTIASNRYNAVIVAAGATPVLPELPGIKGKNVISSLDAFDSAKVGQKVVVVGGGMIGCDVALFLAMQGKNVTITSREKEIGRDKDKSEKAFYSGKMSELGVRIAAGLTLSRIEAGDAIFVSIEGGEKTIEAETFVIAAGLKPDIGLFEQLSAIPDLKYFAVGDCVAPGMIADAIHGGHFAARAIT